jgi:hypothetical protein
MLAIKTTYIQNSLFLLGFDHSFHIFEIRITDIYFLAKVSFFFPFASYLIGKKILIENSF